MNTKNSTQMKTIFKLLFFISISLLLMGSGKASSITQFEISGLPAENIDTFAPSIVSHHISDSGQITDLNISIELGRVDQTLPGFVNEVYWSDLVVLLRKENGPIALLLIGPQYDEFGRFNVTFDDEAVSEIGFGGDQLGSYKPITPLSVFDGVELSGTWDLIFIDVRFPKEGDDLLSWTLSGTTSSFSLPSNGSPVPEPSTVTMAVLGLGALFLGYRRKGN